ncbi:MAG: GGDEF domain-containing protein [Magnetococcales bacterium]|nr:GGDEF domain-containing protein [Magnetococcales bacterium]
MGILVNPRSTMTKKQAQTVLLSRKPSNLVEELDLYRRKNARLSRIYDLHRLLSEKLDLGSMIEAFSVWMTPHFSHDLVAYCHFKSGRMYLSCSCHGPYRTHLTDAAQRLMDPNIDTDYVGWLEDIDRYFHIMALNEEGPESDRLLIIHHNKEVESDAFFMLLQDIIQELPGPLERALVYEDLYDQARRDALTGLVNRRVFKERIEQEVSNAQRYGHPLALACLDLDHFKAVNDKLGHAEGDAVLCKVSQAISGIVRDSDLLARVGGDEFALLLPNTHEERAKVLTQRLCDEVTSLNLGAPGSPSLGVSIGLSCWRSELSTELWMEEADAALYRAKAGGRSQVAV